MPSLAVEPHAAAGAGADAAHMTTPSGRIAAAMLARSTGTTSGGSGGPRHAFSFTPFLQATYHHGLPTDRPICKAYAAGHCPLGTRCPDRHLSAAAAAAAAAGGGGPSYRDRDHGGFISLVCKHWLRGLCKKGEGCEFLHEYNLRKMPECNFFLRNGYCSNGDECLYLHIDPRSKLPPCPDYDNRGFCALGPACPKKHVRRKAICPYYLAGFCPEGRTCKAGAHPKWSPVALVAPQVAAEQAAAAAAAAAAAEAGTDGAMDGGDGAPASPAGDYAMHDGMDGMDGGGGAHGQSAYQRQHHHNGAEGDDDRGRGGDFRGGYSKDKFGGGGGGGGSGGRGGRWRGRGGGRGFRGRGRGEH